jgi:hypothetical protein
MKIQGKQVDVKLAGELCILPTSYLLIFQEKLVDVGLAGKIIPPPTSHLLVFQEE